MRTKPEKDGLQHFTRARNPDLPSVQIDYSDGTNVTIKPSENLKYLGLNYNRKLNFNFHVKTVAEKATCAIGASGMLSNSIHGMTPKNRCLLYAMGVRPITTFGSVVWWKGSGAHVRVLQKTQNLALRLITGAFKTSPTCAMEVELSIPPVDLHLDYLRTKFAV